MKMASRTQRQLNSKGSKVRHQDHQVHRPRNTKKYTDEVREGSIIPAGAGGARVKNVERRQPCTAQPPSLLGMMRNASYACSEIHHSLLMISELVLFVL